MAATRGGFHQLIAPGLASIFFRKLTTMKNESEKWINIMKSKKAFEDELKIAGLGTMIQKGEGAQYVFDDPIQGSTVRYSHLTYGLAFRVTKEMFEDDLYGVMNKMSSELAKAAAYNKDVRATAVLNNAFDSSFTGLDGTELASTAHANLGGGTQSNHITANADMDLPSIQEGIEKFESWTDDRGFEVMTSPEWLIHATGDIWAAGEILESEFIPTSGDNAKNIVRSKYGIKPLHLRHLTDPDAYFIVSKKGDHDMKQWRRVGDQFRSATDPYNDDSIFTARHRISNGHGDWRGVWASPGV